MKLCDAHCHLANLSVDMPLAPLISEATSHGITTYLSSALSKAELASYPSLQAQLPGRLLYSAGIHPSYDECDLEIKDIQKLCEARQIWAIGEIGMDRNTKDTDWMQSIFIRQLELAASYKLPVVLHIVGHQQEAYNILTEFPLRYLIHGYAGSLKAFQVFTKLDCCFTISERILRPDKHDLLQGMLACGRYLFETDITRYYVAENEVNPLLRLINVLNRSAELSGIPIEELTAVQATNYKYLTGYDL